MKKHHYYSKNTITKMKTLKPSVIVLSDNDLYFSRNKFKLLACLKYCKNNFLKNVAQITISGHVSPKKLAISVSDHLKSGVLDFVLYSPKDVLTSTRDMFKLINNTNEKICVHSVVNNAKYTKNKCFLNEETKKKIKDLIKLLNIKSCSKSLIKSHINKNFNNISELINIVKKHVLWTSVTVYKLSNPYTFCKYKKRKVKLTASTVYKKFVNKLIMLKKSESESINEICYDLEHIII
ncbi:conserved non-functional serine recombinase [Pteropox virus]|uniref:Protein OPG061 n=1 Tax=Pteropox virus TaxID=1873698 RepID=A0A1B1MR99_9POXV|nr:conserved non-functional serine recombinase [Pteropox virus]ANS71111.1 conserved non-functional serine recombinase [Pteropox virus]